MLYENQVATKQCYLATKSTRATIKEVKLVEEEREILEDVSRASKAKVMEDQICYELGETSLDLYFLVGSNMKERERTKLIEFLKATMKYTKS